jgi:hypothetical protein
MICGMLAVRVADGADDEGDAGLVESAVGVVEAGGDAGGDAGCQPQEPVLPAAAGKEPGIAAADDGLPVDVGEFGAAVGERGAGGDGAGEVVAVQLSGADDQVAGCVEGAEPGGSGAGSGGQAGLAGLDGGHDCCSLGDGAGAGSWRMRAVSRVSWRSRVISSCWAAIRARAWLRMPASSLMVASDRARRSFSRAISFWRRVLDGAQDSDGRGLQRYRGCR